MTLYSMEYPCGVGARDTGTMLVNLDYFVYSKALDGPAGRILSGGRGDYEVGFAKGTFVIERGEWAKMKAVLSRMSQRGVNVLGEEPEELPDPYETHVETPREETAVSAGLRFSINDNGSMSTRRMPSYQFDDEDVYAISAAAETMATTTATAAAAGGAP